MAGKHWKDCECRRCERGRIEKLQAENQRLREALERIARLVDDDPVVITLVSIANKALEGGDDE